MQNTDKKRASVKDDDVLSLEDIKRVRELLNSNEPQSTMYWDPVDNKVKEIKKEPN